ncbi:MAG: adenylyltransferase/cytidyltransferase family protein [Candidatus Jacksonbacteria bacterium]
MKVVMIFGTFDILHPGHINFLKQAKRHGQLIAVIARNKTVKQVKGKLPRHNEKQRLEAVKCLKLASKVVLGSLTDKYATIKKYQPNVIALGYDQIYFTDQLKDELIKLELNTKIIRLKSFKPNQYKTSLLII